MSTCRPPSRGCLEAYLAGRVHLAEQLESEPDSHFPDVVLTPDAQLSYTEVKERLNLPDDDVGRVLHSLSCAKYKILLKDPASKSIAKTDTFKLNTKFTDRMRRIRVSAQFGRTRCIARWGLCQKGVLACLQDMDRVPCSGWCIVSNPQPYTSNDEHACPRRCRCRRWMRRRRS